MDWGKSAAMPMHFYQTTVYTPQMRYPLQYARGTLYQLYITAACTLYKAQILGENSNVLATIDLGGGGGGAAIEYM